MTRANKKGVLKRLDQMFPPRGSGVSFAEAHKTFKFEMPEVPGQELWIDELAHVDWIGLADRMRRSFSAAFADAFSPAQTGWKFGLREINRQISEVEFKGKMQVYEEVWRRYGLMFDLSWINAVHGTMPYRMTNGSRIIGAITEWRIIPPARVTSAVRGDSVLEDYEELQDVFLIQTQNHLMLVWKEDGSEDLVEIVRSSRQARNRFFRLMVKAHQERLAC